MEAPAPQSGGGGRGLLVFGVLVVAVIAILAIVFIVRKGTCAVPDTNNCPAGQAPYCETSDSGSACTDIGTVCGAFPNGKRCKQENCSYDSKTKKYIWQNCSDSGNTPPITGAPCTVDSTGNLNNPVTIGSVLQSYNIPAKYYKSYIEVVLSNDQKACQLQDCTDPYKTDTITGLCVPSDSGTTTTRDKCSSFSPSEKHNPKDANASWLINYNPPSKPGDEPVQYCTFSACPSGDITDSSGTCAAGPVIPSSCSGYTLVNNNVTEWEYDTSKNSCFIKACNDDWTQGSDIYGPSARCIKICNPDEKFTYIGDADGNCTPSGCVQKDYTLNNGDCLPDCSPGKAPYLAVFEGGAPMNQPGFTYTIIPGINETLTTNKNVCVPASASGPDDLFGGCGSLDYPVYALTGGGAFCGETVNAMTAKFNDGSDGKSSRGCLACQPRYCPPGTLTISGCKNVEVICGYTAELSATSTPQDAVQSCVTNTGFDDTGAIGRYEWETFGAYDSGTDYLDPVGSRYTSGALTILNPEYKITNEFIDKVKVVFSRTKFDANNIWLNHPGQLDAQQLIPGTVYNLRDIISYDNYLYIGHGNNNSRKINIVDALQQVLTNWFNNNRPAGTSPYNIFIGVNTGPPSSWSCPIIGGISYNSYVWDKPYSFYGDGWGTYMNSDSAVPCV